VHLIFSILEVILASDLICLAWLASNIGMSHVKTAVNDMEFMQLLEICCMEVYVYPQCCINFYTLIKIDDYSNSMESQFTATIDGLF